MEKERNTYNPEISAKRSAAENVFINGLDNGSGFPENLAKVRVEREQ